ncbi:molybdenum ABC transporter permease [Aquabacterium sp.]|uniref:molybdate ABC transporter permease subunit n=1 Tax=Aquabacterium sp. TaxID=1872578 RepID=UPI0024892123|nr:ABC transporter permease subunit [Aquabacterium sp.]MDI1349134.1 ABC transporter permease subunit [Aquabacterium sp.]
MSDLETQAVWLSLQLAVVTVLLATPLAVALATVMARTQWRGKVVLDTLILLPMGLPPAFIGVGLLLGLGHGGALGDWLYENLGWRLSFFPVGVVLAVLAMTLPWMVRLLRPAFEATDPMLLAVARSLGASRWRAWWTLTLPMAAPAVASAAALGLAVAWGEAAATLLLAALLQAQGLGRPEAPLDVVQALAAELAHNLVRPDEAGLGQVSAQMATQMSAWNLAAVAWAVALLAVGISELARTRWRRMWRTRLHVVNPAPSPP